MRRGRKGILVPTTSRILLETLVHKAKAGPAAHLGPVVLLVSPVRLGCRVNRRRKVILTTLGRREIPVQTASRVLLTTLVRTERAEYPAHPDPLVLLVSPAR